MKKRFSINDMSVKGKITLFSVMILIFMTIIAAVGLWSSTHVNTARSDRYDTYAMSQYYLSEAYSDFADIKVHLRNILYIYDEPQYSANCEKSISEIQRYEQRVQNSLAAFETRLDRFSKEIQTEYASITKKMKEYMASADKASEYVKNGQIEAGRKDLLENGVYIATEVEEGLLDIADMVSKESDANNVEVERELAIMRFIMIAVIVIDLIITIIYCIILIRNITVPIQKLLEAANKIAIGDINVDCRKINNDDLGELMDKFAEMADGIKEQVKVADEIAKGDFTVKVKLRSDKDVLGKALYKLVKDENNTLNNIKQAGGQITASSEQVASASQALAQGSTEQASALQQVTASMDEVTQRTKNNATEAGEASTLVNNIKDMATEGNDQMKAMIQAMDSINESSETISKIIKTIDDISFQTNILALNAAVEAARAGVHGKGFAVVAEEVRNLAAKSASAAGETAEMIEDSIRKVANGTKIAEATANSLDEIVKSIDSIVELISRIKISSNDQATSITQIDQAISQVSTVVQTNAATSQECAAASEEMSNQAVNLRNLIANYKLTASGQTDSSSYMDMGMMSYDNHEPIISLDGDYNSKY